MTTVSQDNRIVRIFSANSNPRIIVHTDRGLYLNVIQLNQPQNIQLYNIYINGVDYHDQCACKVMLTTSQSKHGSTLFGLL